jgi:indole-3-glycerol phosphate synthase
VLFEVRDPDELERAIEIRSCAIGINTRNLETLAVDPRVGEQLLRLVPRDRVAVYESGVALPADVERAALWGADAVLVGSSLSRESDGTAAVRAFAGVPVVRRG